jgi:hypothetical protein
MYLPDIYTHRHLQTEKENREIHFYPFPPHHHPLLRLIKHPAGANQSHRRLVGIPDLRATHRRR